MFVSGKTMAAAAADWEGLHEDLLGLIVKKIKLIEDFVCFGMVCKSWNEVVTNNKQYLPPQIPWLMLAEDETTKNGRRQIYNLSSSSSKDDDDDKISSRSLYFPPDRRCIGLNHGWMLTISRTGGDMNLVNSLSGNSEIKLPNQTSVDNYNKDYETWPGYLFTTKGALSGNPSESSSNFTLMILHGVGANVCCWRPGNTRWTSTIEIESRLYDLIYSHKDDQFYAISWTGIWACIIQHDSIVLRQVTMIVREIFFPATWIYIVESASPDVLLLVLRDGDIDGNDDVESEGTDEEGQKLYDDTHMKYGLIDFRVYELDLINGGCSKIMNLGDRAIFVGDNTSISFDASQFIGIIKPNKIYFTDDNSEWYPCLIKGGGNDMGCYSLEDARITRFNVGESRSRISPPFWFIPSMTK